MRSLTLEAGTYETLRAELLGSPRARRLHRLHAVMLVARGLSCRRVAQLLGDSPRSVEYWVNRYKSSNLHGLRDKAKGGRRPLLSSARLTHVAVALASVPPAPWKSWSGEALRDYVARRWDVKMGVRIAQRLLARISVENVNNMRNI